jgi:phospho-2-dehydro-3-deoxyheptonate aldolase
LKTIKQYEQFGLENPFIVIDTNHDNSGKNYLEQIRIVRQTLINRDWNESIRKYVRGFMIESYLKTAVKIAPKSMASLSLILAWDGKKPKHSSVKFIRHYNYFIIAKHD